MDIKFNLQQKQSQKLVMTPAMQTQIEILQYNQLELAAFVQNALLENPLLETGEEAGETTTSDEAPESESTENRDEIEWEDYFQHMGDSDYRLENSRPVESDDHPTIEQTSSEALSLGDYLHLQFHLVEEELSSQEQAAGEYLVDCVDDNGYLVYDEDYLLENLGIDEATLEKLVTIIQSFDPPGVGARDLVECLWLQLVDLGLDSELNRCLVTEHLADIAANRLTVVAAATGCTTAELELFAGLLKTLEPKPGRLFAGGENPSYIQPDVELTWDDGEYVVTVKDNDVPRLRLNQVYTAMLKTTAAGSDTKTYITDKLNAALLIIKGIESRKQTIQKIATFLADYQREFFTAGIQALRPLTMKEVAEAVGVHESTVSRAVRGKYIQTPRGVFELKFFFNRGYSAGGESAVPGAVQALIAEAIEGEDKKKPLSDQKLANLLADKGYKIARRTVAKYREALGYAAASGRKKFS